MVYVEKVVLKIPVSDAQKKASANWNRSKDNIMIRPDKEKGKSIRAAASAAGQSVQQYVLQAVDECMERDNVAPDADNEHKEV